MFKHLFATMNEALDVIIEQFPTAAETKKKHMVDNIKHLKALSDSFIEEWLLFEEKMDKWNHATSDLGYEDNSRFIIEMLLNEQSYSGSDAFLRGHGYFQLSMFEHAIGEFKQIVGNYPDFILARLYLALGYLQTGNFTEAYTHFQMIIPQNKSWLI